MSSSDLYESEDSDGLWDSPSITPRATRGTRSQALKSLRASLSDSSIESYRQFLHQTFKDKSDSREDKFNTTQNGVVAWTPQEKRILFDVLDKKGRDGIREIAASIGSKSELEILEYIRLLQKGVRRQHFNDTHSRTAILGEIPAAPEIGEECCHSLDGYAEFLCLEEQREEDSAGKEKHKDLWIINKEVAERLEAGNADHESNMNVSETDQDLAIDVNKLSDEKFTPKLNVNSAAAFFKITKWILLSERFFMNFGGQRLEDNWVNVAFKGETPSMTADVLTEFYEIALAVTRHLIHATHFFASSRVLKSGKASRPSATVVRSFDVRRAARTLKMKTESSEFWVGLARRCSLDVEDRRHRKGWNPIPLDHDEVESLLSQKELPQEPYGRVSRNSSSIPGKDLDNIANDLSSEFVDEESSDPEDEHAEALDKQHNSAEELICWTTMGQSPPEIPESEFPSNQIPTRPSGKRKTTEELADWRDRTLYRSEWEEYGYETEKIDSELENRQKRRRLTAHFRPLSKVHSWGINRESSDRKGEGRQGEEEAAANADLEYQSEATDPEFRPGSTDHGQKAKSKFISRTSSRKRTPVSYAPPPLLDFDMEMGVNSESNDEDPNPDSQKDHETIIQQERSEDKDHEEERVFSGSDDNLPIPQERSISSEAEDDSDDQDEHLYLSTRPSPSDSQSD